MFYSHVTFIVLETSFFGAKLQNYRDANKLFLVTHTHTHKYTSYVGLLILFNIAFVLVDFSVYILSTISQIIWIAVYIVSKSIITRVVEIYNATLRRIERKGKFCLLIKLNKNPLYPLFYFLNGLEKFFTKYNLFFLFSLVFLSRETYFLQ